MAMAFAPAAILFPGLIINNPEVVSKSYPRFWEDLEKAGYKIQQS
jgi:3-phosphoshikimate 1-carboxyvinyltransferase